MGKALILPDADFSNVGLGKATYNGEPDLQAIWIVGPNEVIGERATYTAAFYPPTTPDKTVTWSIVSGNAYATISNGVVTIDQSANNDTIVIAATSTVDSSIVGLKSVVVTYRSSTATLWDDALADPDFATIMAGATKKFELSSPMVKDGTTPGTDYPNPITSVTQEYVVLFDATFPVQVNTDQPCLFIRLGPGAAIACLLRSYNFWYFMPKFSVSPGNDMGIPKEQGFHARILLYFNPTTKQLKIKNLTNNQLYTYTTGAVSGTIYENFCLGGGGSSANYYNGTISEFYIGTL